jgi:hypothetical protein
MATRKYFQSPDVISYRFGTDINIINAATKGAKIINSTLSLRFWARNFSPRRNNRIGVIKTIKLTIKYIPKADNNVSIKGVSWRV